MSRHIAKDHTICDKCGREYSKICFFCQREALRHEYSDQYLYDNIIGIEYSDWTSEYGRYSNKTPARYIHIRDDAEGCGIDVAGYVKRKDDDYDDDAYNSMSLYEQWLYNVKHCHLEYLEESFDLRQFRECLGKDFVQNFFGTMWFDNFSPNEESYSFLSTWPTFIFDGDYLRQCENWDEESINNELGKGLAPSFELVFYLRNGSKIYIDGVSNMYSEEWVENLMSHPVMYGFFRNKIQLSDWNYMFNASIT